MSRLLPVSACLGIVFLVSTASAGQIAVTYDSAGSQQPLPSLCSDCFLTFNNLKKGIQNYTAAFGTTGVTGTYTNIDIVPADLYGGADATGKYAVVGARSGTASYTLSLNRPVSYFGLWWSAGSPLNSLQFFSAGASLGTFSTADLIPLLGTCSKTSTNPFCGNPNSLNREQDRAELFTYLNFFGANGTAFDKIVFRNSGATSFESDNHAVLPSVPGTFTGTQVETLGTSEPATLVLLFIPALLLYRNRRRFLQGC